MAAACFSLSRVEGANGQIGQDIVVWINIELKSASPKRIAARKNRTDRDRAARNDCTFFVSWIGAVLKARAASTNDIEQKTSVIVTR